MSSLSDSISFSNISTPSNSLPANYSRRESLIFDDSYLENVACPICNETMINAFQLNQHLDDVHTDTATDQKDSIIKWFKNAMKPLSKTKNLSTNLSQISQMAIHRLNDHDANWLDQNSDFVTRDHWQKEGDNDQCTNSSCDKTLNLKNGKHNCRKCGKFFCDAHCHISMKLDKQAQHDPVNGYWCRVCEDCFQSRIGYLDTEGVIRSHTAAFTKCRTKGIERAHLEGNRLEKRLEKLAKVYATETKPINSTQGGLKPPLTLKHRRRASEQLIVKWEDDGSVTSCPLCETSFGKITNRKHHCRLCGRVVCEKCSSKISLNLNGNYSETPEQDCVGEIRACKKCRNAVFRRKEYNEETSKTPPVVMLYQKLTKIKSAIESTLPKFQDMLVMLKSQEIVNQTHADYQVAARTRKELLENFTQFDAISKKINSLLVRSESERRLKSNIHLAANQYLQQNMLPLSLLPKIFKKDANDHAKDADDEDESSPEAILASFTNGRTRTISTSSAKSLKGEEKLRQQLSVLLEQAVLVDGYISEANRKRKFDDARTLNASLEELKLEIDKKRKELGDSF